MKRLIDIYYFREALVEIEFPKEDFFSRRANLEDIKEFMCILIDYPQIYELLLRLYDKRGLKEKRRGRQERQGLNPIFSNIDSLFEIFEAGDRLSHSVMKHEAKEEKEKSTDYDEGDIGKLGEAFGRFEAQLQNLAGGIESNKDYLGKALTEFFKELSIVVAKLEFERTKEGGFPQNVTCRQSRELIKNLSAQVSMILNPWFTFEYDFSGSKRSKYLKNPYIIELDETTENFLHDLKLELKRQCILQNDITDEISIQNMEEDPSLLKMDYELCPSMIIIWVRNDANLANSSEIFEFNLSSLSDKSLEEPKHDCTYELTTIITFRNTVKNEGIFEVITKNKDKWGGIMNGNDIDFDEEYFTQTAWNIVENPVLLIYTEKVTIPVFKYLSNKPVWKSSMQSKEEREMIDEDITYAKQLQKQFDNEEKEEVQTKITDFYNNSPGKSSPNDVEMKDDNDCEEVKYLSPDEQDVEIKPDEWRCTNCTFINPKSKYYCEVCQTKNTKRDANSIKTPISATKKILERDISPLKNVKPTRDKSQDFKDNDSRFQCRFCKSMSQVSYCHKCYKRREDCDIKMPHCEICKKKCNKDSTKCRTCKTEEKSKSKKRDSKNNEKVKNGEMAEKLDSLNIDDTQKLVNKEGYTWVCQHCKFKGIVPFKKDEITSEHLNPAEKDYCQTCSKRRKVCMIKCEECSSFMTNKSKFDQHTCK
ncbi:unnamed protein product [Moneuplotes crassus]|uniref:RanBP2-type domain-containing protein n=1 Tax=Euplotes crassus TaxID=5936 RepID=A0AAD2D3P2_EUPCR|nr:unnamed protein product [Moneuplotes crassus]